MSSAGDPGSKTNAARRAPRPLLQYILCKYPVPPSTFSMPVPPYSRVRLFVWFFLNLFFFLGVRGAQRYLGALGRQGTGVLCSRRSTQTVHWNVVAKPGAVTGITELMGCAFSSVRPQDNVAVSMLRDTAGDALSRPSRRVRQRPCDLIRRASVLYT